MPAHCGRTICVTYGGTLVEPTMRRCATPVGAGVTLYRCVECYDDQQVNRACVAINQLAAAETPLSVMGSAVREALAAAEPTNTCPARLAATIGANLPAALRHWPVALLRELNGEVLCLQCACKACGTLRPYLEGDGAVPDVEFIRVRARRGASLAELKLKSHGDVITRTSIGVAGSHGTIVETGWVEVTYGLQPRKRLREVTGLPAEDDHDCASQLNGTNGEATNLDGPRSKEARARRVLRRLGRTLKKGGKEALAALTKESVHLIEPTMTAGAIGLGAGPLGTQIAQLAGQAATQAASKAANKVAKKLTGRGPNDALAGHGAYNHAGGLTGYGSYAIGGPNAAHVKLNQEFSDKPQFRMASARDETGSVEISIKVSAFEIYTPDGTDAQVQLVFSPGLIGLFPVVGEISRVFTMFKTLQLVAVLVPLSTANVAAANTGYVAAYWNPDPSQPPDDTLLQFQNRHGSVGGPVLLHTLVVGAECDPRKGADDRPRKVVLNLAGETDLREVSPGTFNFGLFGIDNATYPADKPLYRVEVFMTLRLYSSHALPSQTTGALTSFLANSNSDGGTMSTASPFDGCYIGAADTMTLTTDGSTKVFLPDTVSGDFFVYLEAELANTGSTDMTFLPTGNITRYDFFNAANGVMGTEPAVYMRTATSAAGSKGAFQIVHVDPAATAGGNYFTISLGTGATVSTDDNLTLVLAAIGADVPVGAIGAGTEWVLAGVT